MFSMPIAKRIEVDEGVVLTNFLLREILPKKNIYLRGLRGEASTHPLCEPWKNSTRVDTQKMPHLSTGWGRWRDRDIKILEAQAHDIIKKLCLAMARLTGCEAQVVGAEIDVANAEATKIDAHVINRIIGQIFNDSTLMVPSLAKTPCGHAHTGEFMLCTRSTASLPMPGSASGNTREGTIIATSMEEAACRGDQHFSIKTVIPRTSSELSAPIGILQVAEKEVRLDAESPPASELMPIKELAIPDPKCLGLPRGIKLPSLVGNRCRTPHLGYKFKGSFHPNAIDLEPQGSREHISRMKFARVSGYLAVE